MVVECAPMKNQKNKKEIKPRDNGRKQVIVLVPPDILAEYDAALLQQYKVGGKRSQHLLAMIEKYVAERRVTELPSQ